MKTLIHEEKEKKKLEDAKPKLITALGAHLAKLVTSKSGETWHAGGREAEKSATDYMAQCEALLSKLDGRGWSRCDYYQRGFTCSCSVCVCVCVHIYKCSCIYTHT